MYLEFNMKMFGTNLFEIFLCCFIFSKHFIFSIKVVCVLVTYYRKHVVGYGHFTKKEIHRGLIDELTGVGQDKQYEVERVRKLLALLYAK